MDLLLIGSDYFKPWLVKAGAKVRHLGNGADCEIKADPNRVDLQAIISSLDQKPDLVLLTDDLGARVLPSGLERVSIPKVYYGVDSPINLYWQKWLSGMFDVVCLDQRDQARGLAAELGREVSWLPVGVDPSLYIGDEERPILDFAFVGTVEENVRPKRSAILSLLQERYSVELAGGRGGEWVGPQEAASLYQHSRLVLNENLFPGLTTRMLEVMAAGGCLFSEDTDNGVRDLFSPGVHYIAFDESNILDQADRYINNPAARSSIAKKGRELCRARHSIQTRTQSLLSLIQGLRQRAGRPDLNSLAWSYLLLGVRWPGPEAARRVIKAGLLFNEFLRHEPSSIPALTGAGLTLLARSKHAEALDLLQRMRKRIKRDFRLRLIQGYLLYDTGKIDQARASFTDAAKMADSKKRVGQGLLDSRVSPGCYDFHLLWGLLLKDSGDGLCPGFDRSRLPMAFWGGAEHLRRAVELDPERIEALEHLARIMDQEGQFGFSHSLWRRAAVLAPGNKMIRDSYMQAARKGYIRI